MIYKYWLIIKTCTMNNDTNLIIWYYNITSLNWVVDVNKNGSIKRKQPICHFEWVDSEDIWICWIGILFTATFTTDMTLEAHLSRKKKQQFLFAFQTSKSIRYYSGNKTNMQRSKTKHHGPVWIHEITYELCP
jgi:hypothetical protein